MSHTNENEFNSFVSNKKNEALKDRMILIRVPYNLRVSEEVKIYEKLLHDSSLKGIHIAPHTLRVASMFAILTRLEASKKAGLSVMKKLKLYDGDTSWRGASATANPGALDVHVQGVYLCADYNRP